MLRRGAFHRLYELKLELRQLERIGDSPDVLAGVRQSYQQHLAAWMLQLDDIVGSLKDILSSRKRHRSYEQIHMYNNPEMNIYLHQAERPIIR